MPNYSMSTNGLLSFGIVGAGEKVLTEQEYTELQAVAQPWRVAALRLHREIKRLSKFLQTANSAAAAADNELEKALYEESVTREALRDALEAVTALKAASAGTDEENTKRAATVTSLTAQCEQLTKESQQQTVASTAAAEALHSAQETANDARKALECAEGQYAGLCARPASIPFSTSPVFAGLRRGTAL